MDLSIRSKPTKHRTVEKFILHIPSYWVVVRRIRKFTIIRYPEGEHTSNKGSITGLVTKPKSVALNRHIVISLGNHGNKLISLLYIRIGRFGPHGSHALTTV